MISQAAARALIEEDHNYEEAGQRLGVSPGLTYLAATGVPTDSSDGLTVEEYGRTGMLVSAQHLSSPPIERPDRSSQVREFLGSRCQSDSQMQAAAGQS
jgi:hypothetical protein